MDSRSYIISLTTVPERLSNPHPDGFKRVVTSLVTQQFNNYEVHLNIPTIYRPTHTPYLIPTWLTQLADTLPHCLKIFRCEDYGPPTKVIPTLHRVTCPDTIIIGVDDDLIYHPDLIAEHQKYQRCYDYSSVILYDGRGAVTPQYHDLRDGWVLCPEKPIRVKSLQHYKSVSYRRGLFDSDLFTEFVGHTNDDDVMMSCYFNSKDIPMVVVPYEPDIPKVATFEQWHSFQGVCTFPVIAHAHSVPHTGCNHPEILKTQPRWFVPEKFKPFIR